MMLSIEHVVWSRTRDNFSKAEQIFVFHFSCSC